ncbi:hypothetical protein MTOK_16050 [Mycolicibacterium tokaiense]|nr:hypothetical protein MTOK_16050 [Mycolicibacterium tokaiense]
MRAGDFTITITNTPSAFEAGDFVARITFRDDRTIAGLVSTPRLPPPAKRHRACSLAQHAQLTDTGRSDRILEQCHIPKPVQVNRSQRRMSSTRRHRGEVAMSFRPVDPEMAAVHQLSELHGPAEEMS